MKGQRHKKGPDAPGGEREGLGSARRVDSKALGADVSQTIGSIIPPDEGAGVTSEQIVAALAVLVRLFVTKPTGVAPSPELEPWLTVAQGARHAAVSGETLRDWVTQGMLPAGRCGRVLRVRRSDIDTLLTRGTAVDRSEQRTEELSPRAREILATLHRR